MDRCLDEFEKFVEDAKNVSVTIVGKERTLENAISSYDYFLFQNYKKNSDSEISKRALQQLQTCLQLKVRLC